MFLLFPFLAVVGRRHSFGHGQVGFHFGLLPHLVVHQKTVLQGGPTKEALQDGSMVGHLLAIQKFNGIGQANQPTLVAIQPIHQDTKGAMLGGLDLRQPIQYNQPRGSSHIAHSARRDHLYIGVALESRRKVALVYRR